MERPSLTDTAYDHMGLLVSGSLALVVVVRLLSISEWNPPTAAAILQHTGSTNVILGIAVSAAPAVLATLLSLGGCRTFYEWTRQRRPTSWAIWLAVVSFVFLLLVANVAQFALAVLVWGAAALFGRWDRGADPNVAKSTNRRAIGSLIASTLMADVLLATSSWLATERVSIDDGDAFTAYVLEGDDNSTWVVLRDTPRRVEFIPVAKDRTRTLCTNQDDFYSKRLIDFAGSGPGYVECPDAD